MTDKLETLGPLVAVARGRSVPLLRPPFLRRKLSKKVSEAGLGEWCCPSLNMQGSGSHPPSHCDLWSGPGQATLVHLMICVGIPTLWPF